MSNSTYYHPLHHEGTSRIERLIHALRPDAFQLDERSIQELIVEAHRFARTLRFFDETNTQPSEGDNWEGFWEVEILTYLAVLAAKDTDEIRRKFQELNDKFEQDKSAKPVPGAQKILISLEAPYQPLLDMLRTLALSLEEAYQKLVRIKHPLQTLLLNRIRRDNRIDQEELESALIRLIGYHKSADDKLDRAKYEGFFAPDQRWGIIDRVHYDAIPANPQFNQNDLRELFNTFFNTWLVLKNAAQTGFDEELARMELPEEVEYRIVQPHVVLFLVFLRLFRYAQESLNELGAKHLDFYYEEILGLRRRGEVPDQVYLLFELAKDFDQHLLEKGTEFSAGKDKNGQPLLFETIEDWVLRPAQVADIKNTWIDPQCGGIHANPNVKKAYRNGAEKPNEKARYWRSMGDDHNLPDGEVGFAIASPQLILREGKRVVDVWLNIVSPEPLGCSWLEDGEYLKVFLSSTESWIELEYNPQDIGSDTAIPDLAKGSFNVFFDPANPSTSPNNPGAPATIHIRIILERDDPAVDTLGEELANQAGFDTQWPVLKVLINQELEKPCPTDTQQSLTSAEVYESLRQLVIGEAMIKVDVRGIREHLIIQTDQGVFDGTQKVFPFGPVPEVGNRFYIGSTEVFQKALDSLQVRFEWIAPPKDFTHHYQGYSATIQPKIQIDFIDRADATSSDQEGKVEFTADNIGSTMKVFGKVINLGPSSTDPITVSVGNGSPVKVDPVSDIHNIDLNNVLFDASIKIYTISGGSLDFNLGKSNRFKAYLIPAAAAASVDKIPVNTRAEIEVRDNNGDPVSGLSIQLNGIDVDPDDDGKYFVNVSDLDSKDLVVKAGSFQDVTLQKKDYDHANDEFRSYSRIDIKLYPDAPKDRPSAPVPSVNFISGIVVDREASPIVGAKVTAFKTGVPLDKSKVTGETDKDGKFTLAVDAGSNWTIQAVKNGSRSDKLTNAQENQSYALQISDEIKVSDPFRGKLKGSVKSIDKDMVVYGAKIIGNKKTLGVTDENGEFEIDRVSADSFTIINEAYNELSIDIEDNAEYEITLIPKETFIVFTGRVVPVFNPDSGLPDVDVMVPDTAIRTRTDQTGDFTIAVPTDLANFTMLTFSKSGFKTKKAELPINPVSSIKVVLAEANPVDLLMPDTFAYLAAKISKGSISVKSATTSSELFNKQIVLPNVGQPIKTIDWNQRSIRNWFEVPINKLNVKRDPRTQFFERYSPTLKRGFLRLKLVNTDFLHNQYSKVLIKQTLLLAKNSQTPIPNPPYTPATNNISLDYSSTQIITGADNEKIDQFFHLLPFNGHKLIPLDKEPEVRLIYPYMPDDTLPVTVKQLDSNGKEQIVVMPYAPGNLFIGISNLTPGGTLSLLFQIEEGTELQPEALTPPIHWSCLTGNNTWRPFNVGEIIRDNTGGLTRSGLIQFAIPTAAVKENTMLNPDYFWLRAAARQADTAAGEADTTVHALPSISNIRAQVVQARFKNQENDLAHLAQPLPAGTITKLLESRTAVKKVEQPLESFGGKLPESAGMDFYYRVSERLRHKDRAVTVWDYERLLLEHYPLVAAAKCIQHTRYKPAEKASELAPGFVTVAVIPDLKKRKGEPWPEPRFTRGDLEDMRQFLAARANLLVAYGTGTEARLQVVNPLYEKVDVLVHVAFKPGSDEAFCKEILKQELTCFISPWLGNPATPPVFGRALERSAILQFLEERPYVDYVLMDDNKFKVQKQADLTAADGKIYPETARSILVAGNIVVGSNKDTLSLNSPVQPTIDTTVVSATAEVKTTSPETPHTAHSKASEPLMAAAGGEKTGVDEEQRADTTLGKTAKRRKQSENKNK